MSPNNCRGENPRMDETVFDVNVTHLELHKSRVSLRRKIVQYKVMRMVMRFTQRPGTSRELFFFRSNEALCSLLY